MPAITWPLSSRPGLSDAEGAGRLINAFAERLGDGARAPVSVRRAPGLSRFVDVGVSGPRGARQVGPVVFAAYQNALVRISEDRTVVTAGPLPGSERITIARNNRQPNPDAVAVTELGTYRLPLDGAPQPLQTPSGLPAPNSVCELFGILFFTAGNGDCYATGTWSNPLRRPLGRQGESRTRINLLRTGMTGPQGRIWRVDVSDPVYCALLGGAMAVEARTE